MRSALLARLLLFGFSVAISLLIIDLIGRQLIPDATAKRVLLYSETPWQRWPDGSLSFQPHRSIRSGAVYGEAIDYDVTFSTNDQGFVDDVDYAPLVAAPSQRSIAVVGDSFTAGFHGGEAWVPSLRRARGFDTDGMRLYNFGVSATGILNFERLLARYHPQLGFDDVLMVLISSDVSRVNFEPLSDGDRIIMCEEGTDHARCLARRARMYAFDASLSHSDLLAFGRAKAESYYDSFWARQRAQSFLAWMLRNALAQSQRDVQGAVGLERFATLAGIVEGARVTVLHIPMKEELLAGGYRVDVTAAVETAEFRYIDGMAACGLEVTDFHSHDSHPAAAGYAKLRSCALAALGIAD